MIRKLKVGEIYKFYLGNHIFNGRVNLSNHNVNVDSNGFLHYSYGTFTTKKYYYIHGKESDKQTFKDYEEFELYVNRLEILEEI